MDNTPITWNTKECLSPYPSAPLPNITTKDTTQPKRHSNGIYPPRTRITSSSGTWVLDALDLLFLRA
jgi:hypothetical protein